MDLYRSSATELDRLAISLQPPTEFVEIARRALGALGAALRERRGLRDAAAPTWRVLKIAKVGSQGRGNLRVSISKQGQSSEAAGPTEMGDGPGAGEGFLSVFIHLTPI